MCGETSTYLDPKIFAICSGEVSKVLLEKEKLPNLGASADHAVVDLTKQVRPPEGKAASLNSE